MSTIFYLALQCCQCSTMQVKQRKKNSKSHEWTCVVCNQKQSIRKVFAEGPMAKDLRLFVQSFNMSRHSHPSQSPPIAEERLSHGSPKRPGRSDWTEFLDPDKEFPKPVPKPGIDFGAEIVTELPGEGPFKRAKLNNCVVRDELYKPVFSKRNASKEVKFKKNEVDDDKKLRKVRVAERREASKWRHFVTRDDSGKGQSAYDRTTDDMLESLIIEEMVEDEEIHPDFL